MPGGCISLLTADTSSPVRPPEPVLRFRDPYHPGNLQQPPPPLIPAPIPLPLDQLQQRYANFGRPAFEKQPTSSTSTAASVTGNNNFDPAKSDATFAPPHLLAETPQAEPTTDAYNQSVVASHVPKEASKASGSAGQQAEDLQEAIIVFPSSWTRGKLIGAGAFGQVYMGLNNDTGEFFAVKQVALTKDEGLKSRQQGHVRALEAEVAVLRQLRNEHIVQYIGTERTVDTLNIFLEYIAGGSIASLIDKFGPLQENVVRVYTKQILKGIEYLHQRKIMHRDIKGANILVDKKGTIKLADFGASKKIEDLATMGSAGSGAKSIRGTPYWMAPEVIKQTGHGRPADIWSLGCVVIEMATGKPPWSDYSPVAAMWHIASTGDMPTLPGEGMLSAEARDFLHQCFNRVPRDRPNATRLLKHPWLENVQLPSARAAAAVATAAAAAASSSFGTSSNPVLRHHPAANSMMMQPSSGLWSPPSPIKEEPEGPLLSAAASAQPPAPQTAAHAPPSAAKKQLQMNQAADTAAPQAALQQQQAPMAASLHLTVPAPCPNAAAEQFDTIYSPSQIPSGLLAADKSAQEGAAPAANAGLPVAPKPPTGVMLDPEAEVDRQLLHLALYGSISIPEGHNCTAAGSIGGGTLAGGGTYDDYIASQRHLAAAAGVRDSVPVVRSSMLTLNFNPMEEPSWGGGDPSMAPQVGMFSPLPVLGEEEDGQEGAGETEAPAAADVVLEQDQPSPRHPATSVLGESKSGARRSEAALRQMPQSTLTAKAVPGGDASVRDSKMQRWRDELLAELESKRQEHRASMAVQPGEANALIN